MCGICGIVNLKGDLSIHAEDLLAMRNTIRHRGPDDQGELMSGPVALGFRRLSIVDLTTGHQPMANEDGTAWIVFNGEIYNHSQLRLRLQELGHRYATNSDTETILHLYEEYGKDCVQHLRGMFAFAIWDTCRKRIFCARDRVGIKPFYYALRNGCFAFASEIKALLEMPGVRSVLNHRALPEFFAFGYLSSEETMFDGIRKLLPGHYLIIDLNKGAVDPQIMPYWDLNIPKPEHLLKEADYIAQFRELFEETVRLHLMSDVPLGVFLSGGLDSSSIAAVVAGLRKDRIQTFSVGYAEDRFSELPQARIVAKHIGAEHHEVRLGPEDFFRSLPQLIWYEDEPLVWPSSVALYYVSCLASKKVKVVLTGEGADEVFAGYLKYRVTLWNLRGAPAYRKLIPEPLQHLVHKVLGSDFLPDAIGRKLRHSFLYHPDAFERIYFDNFYSAFSREQQAQLYTPETAQKLRSENPYANSLRYFSDRGHSDNLLERLLYLDIKTYLVELLMKQDQMSMATSIESRVPFLDHKLVEFTMSVPSSYKVHHMTGKYLLRQAMSDRLPPEVLGRTKKGFPTPIRPWLRNQLFEKLTAVLDNGRLAQRSIVRADVVRRLLEEHRRGSSAATECCWRLLNFELWCRIFLDREFERGISPSTKLSPVWTHKETSLVSGELN